MLRGRREGESCQLCVGVCQGRQHLEGGAEGYRKGSEKVREGDIKLEEYSAFIPSLLPSIPLSSPPSLHPHSPLLLCEQDGMEVTGGHVYYLQIPL